MLLLLGLTIQWILSYHETTREKNARMPFIDSFAKELIMSELSDIDGYVWQ